ncbi:MAG: hypothetical protein ACI9XJ_002482 [Marivirga sp.]|jgi:hypothetical protein
MKKSRIFLSIGILFMSILFYVVYDMSTKTKFPKGKPSKSILRDSTHLIIDSAAVRNEKSSD